MISLALMKTDMIRYSATTIAYVADYGTTCKVDMGNVGQDTSATGEYESRVLGVREGKTPHINLCGYSLGWVFEMGEAHLKGLSGHPLDKAVAECLRRERKVKSNIAAPLTIKATASKTPIGLWYKWSQWRTTHLH